MSAFLIISIKQFDFSHFFSCINTSILSKLFMCQEGYTCMYIYRSDLDEGQM